MNTIILSLALTLPGIIIVGDTADPQDVQQNLGPMPFGLSQYVGDGRTTPIGQYFFASATHLGLFSSMTFAGQTYDVVQGWSNGDLSIYQVSTPFPVWAPIYTGSPQSMIGQPMVMAGNGVGRSSPTYNTQGQLTGWTWSGSSPGTTWGIGTVQGFENLGQVVPGETFGRTLYSEFINNNEPNEGTYSGGDSGGPDFVLDATTGIYEFAGVNSAITLPDAAYFGQSSFAADIPDRLAWVEGIIGVPEPSPLWLLLAFGIAFAWRRFR